MAGFMQDGTTQQAGVPGRLVGATFVEPRGALRAAVAGAVGNELGGAVGSFATSLATSAANPGSTALRPGQLGYLAVYHDGYQGSVVLFRAKRGMFKPKPTTEVLASVPMAAVRGVSLTKARIGQVLEIALAEGPAWQFDIPRIHQAGARQVVTALGG